MSDTTTFFGGTNGGFAQSSDFSYSVARAGSGAIGGGGNADSPVGQREDTGFYDVWQTFLEFNTAAIPDTSSILTATLSLYGKVDNSTTDFTVEVRVDDYGTFAVADFVAGASLSGLTRVATFASSGYANEAYNAFTSDAAFLTNINKTGPTRLNLSSDRQRVGNTPSGPEWMTFYGPGESGTSKDPKLVVTYTVVYEGDFLGVGVATLGADGSVAYGGDALLQGVAVGTADGFYGAGGQAVLQAVTSLLPTADAAPLMDFTTYDAYIDAGGDVRGLIFFNEQKPQTVARQLEPVRQNVGNNPDEIRPDFGNFFAQSDFSHGMGQRYFHQPGRDPKKVFYIEGFDISEPGRLSHLHALAEARDTTTIGVAAQVGDKVFVVNGQRVDRSDGFPGSWVQEDPSAADADQDVNDIAAEGARLFAAINTSTAGVRVRSSAGTWTRYQPDGATDLVAGTPTRVAWLKERLMVVGGTNSRSIYEVLASSTPTALETLPEGWTFQAIFEAGGFIHACAVNVDAGWSRVHHYALNTAGTALEKKSSTRFPQGQLIYCGDGFPGIAFIAGGVRNDAGGYDAILYRATMSDRGELDYTEIRQEEGAGVNDLSTRAVTVMGEEILVGWSVGSATFGGSRDGIAVYHVARDAFAYHLKKTGGGSAKRIADIMPFKGQVLVSISGDGLYYEDLTTLATTATLVTSLADWNNAGQKVWDRIEVSHAPLGASTSVKVEYGLEAQEDASWTEVFTSSVLDSEGDFGSISNVKSRLFALRITSTATTTVDQEFLGYSVRSLPAPDRNEFQLTRFIQLVYSAQKDEDGQRVLVDPRAMLAYLQDAMFTFVNFHESGFSWTAWLEDVSTFEPEQPMYETTGGEALRDVFYVQLKMTGAR